MNRRRRTLAAVTAGLALTASALLCHPGLAAGAGAPPVLKLEASPQTLTRVSYDGEIDLDLAMDAVAGNRPFEVRAYRFDYAQPIRAWWVRPGADTLLPTGLVKDFKGLSDFFVVTITDAAGRTAFSTTTSFCPTGASQVRRRPDAPATTPYPSSCPTSNPYSLGAVYGLQRGWSDAIGYDDVIALAPGSYTATMSINPAYRSVLGIAPSDATASVWLDVVPATGADVAAVRSVPRTAAATPRPTRVAAPSAPVGRAGGSTGPRPDLRSLPAWGISVMEGRYLRFSTTVWNAGPSPLVVDGFLRPTEPTVMDAYQYFFDARGRQVGYASVGTIHGPDSSSLFSEFATHRLLDAQKRLVLQGEEDYFCLADTDAIDYTVAGANWHPENARLHSNCGGPSSVSVREVLDVGSGNTYVQYLEGQSFDLSGLRNGVYYLYVGANPGRQLYERSTSNNDSYRKITLGGSDGHRTVRATPVGLVLEPPPPDDED